MGFCNSQLSSLGSDPNQKTLNMKTMLIVMLAICAMVVAEEETLQAEEQTLISYGAYPHAFRYGYGALPYAGLSYAARAVLPPTSTKSLEMIDQINQETSKQTNKQKQQALF